MTSDTASKGHVGFSDLTLGLLPPGPIRDLAEDLANRPDPGLNVLVSMASELTSHADTAVPDWADTETKFFVVVDVPLQAIPRIPAILGLHKPHLRLHISADAEICKRLVLAQTRPRPWEGIVDAYTVGDCLVVVHGDATIREFPKSRLPRLHGLGPDAFHQFEIDPSGSYLYWPASDTHLGPSQLLQAVDPMYLADVEVERYAREKTSLALLDMREERGLRQTEIPGLSDRHVRRLENEEARLTLAVATAYAEAFGLEMTVFLEELGHRLAAFNQIDSSEPPAAAGAG